MNYDVAYPDFIARFYDLTYSQIRDNVDKEFYLNKIKSTEGKVLEIGVGTGRIFCDALKSGSNIFGIDSSESMLTVLKSKIQSDEHFRISKQDIINFSFDFKFDLIIAPFRVFSHLIEVENQLKALNNIYEYLTDDGLFIFDVFVPDLKLISTELNNIVDFEGEMDDGKKIKRITSMKPDYINQLVFITMSYVWDESNVEKDYSWNFIMRFFFRFELENLINRSKLKLISIFGDFFENHPSNDSKDFVVVCRK